MARLPNQYLPLEEELKRNPQLKMSDLQMLQGWVKTQAHLPQNLDLLYVHFFFHSNYYCIEPTKRTIDNFYTVRTYMPEVFSNRDPIAWKDLRKAFTVGAIVPLEQKTKEGYIMTLGKFLDTDPNKFDENEILKYLFMTCEIQNLTGGTSEGQIIIIDACGLSFGHISRINVTLTRKFLYYVQEAAPIRLKAIHILNTMPLVNIFFNIVKPFLKSEIIKLIQFHSSIETVQKFLPIEALPNESGGKAGPIAEMAAKQIKLLEEYREWFQYDEIVGRVNESLRVGEFQQPKGLFDLKKFDID